MPRVTKLTTKLAGIGAVAGWLVIHSSPAAFAQNAIEADADEVLSAMSAFLGELLEFSVDYEADFDVIAPSGQKLKFLSSGEVTVQRPDKLHLTRTGTVADVELILDGEALTIYGRHRNGYVQLSAFSIDEAIARVRDDLGFDAPGADFLSESPFDRKVTDVVRGVHVGMTNIAGIPVHHLAFRGEQVDWQLWVQDGDQPLPIKYVITSKWTTGAPEYSLQFSNWNVAPSIDPEVFSFAPPGDATKFSSMRVDDTGEIVNTWE